ncbi:MAG: hypothetical protein AVDCRST_MAG91-63 [uncultured Sphingomonadaceae bacterium]|uniref:DUF2231 domain-containing protein n=1 Tax=uncultured Sphingomonadaceae bacterium TaxID=169976 RepID=A0A6J4RUM2_9SPHN|nr:MAG: hypothetical protein AVDCRST_MAG91-63 [uncultured Sphingomonadaceae bacterium]
MAVTSHRGHARIINPVPAVLVAGALALFLGAFLADWAYASSYQVQWVNFASWLIAGALVFTAFALVWAAVNALRKDGSRGRGEWLPIGLLAATFLLGLSNALVHAKDGWAAMPAGLILSLVVLLLALAATWVGFSQPRTGETS